VWRAHERFPGPISQEKNISTSFESLGLSAELLRAVAEQGYTTPTPIQAQAIPVVLSGRDLLGAAQTGTGKTAGFTLPMLQKFSVQANASTSPARHPIRALILVPTRELAAQVQESVRTYGKHLKLRSAVIFGGVGFNPQADELRRGVDIVVATPGRLLDHVEQRTIDLRHVEILVLDEADRMLDMGFIPAIRRVLALLPAKRQNLLFSATFPDEIRKLTKSFMHDPVTVEVAARNKPVELISQIAHPVDSGRKRELLSHLVKTNNWQQVLVFTRTKHGANRLAQQLERDGIDADAIHGNKSQGARTRALKRFKSNELQVLVATDIAARGLDIEELPHVVNYDLPHVAEDYVHRIGRTGRAGASGEAVALVSGEDRSLLAAIERLIGRRIEQKVVAGFEPGSRGAPQSGAQPRHQPQRQQQQRREQGRQGGGRGNGQHRGQPGNRQHGGQGRGQNSGPHGGGQGRGQRSNPGNGQGQHADHSDDNRGNSWGSQPGGQRGGQQPREANGNGGHRQQPGGRPEHRQGSRPPRQGPQQRHGQYPQRSHHSHQPANARKPELDEQAEESQPPPERAGNQLFPGLLGNLGRKIFRR
jgi:ATP-dependent RNA helicase RhlE